MAVPSEAFFQSLGIPQTGRIHYQLSPARLTEEAIIRQEGVMSSTGAFTVNTGKYTGRSPRDRFVVDLPTIHDQIDWGSVNRPISPEKFESLRRRMMAYLQGKDLFVFDGFAGAEERFRLPLRVINQYAWQNMFVHQLFIRPTQEELDSRGDDDLFTVIAAPGFQADPEFDGVNSEAFVMLHLEKKLILIGGTYYAGEMKKSIFSVMNFLLPAQGVLPMHCSANIGPQGDTALFFGLSGTGKTTLSADPDRRLIGDDEHGWWDGGIFNFEGGCYAKCINLSQKNEPQIWEAIRAGAVLENVVLDDETRVPDYSDSTLTENSRAAYPLDYIPGAVLPSVGPIPTTLFFLCADAFGVMPPIARLTTEQAMYYFLAGYTSKLAGTERGLTAPEATFSACFGDPFLPRSPKFYAKMLGEWLDKGNVRVFLLNTGWVGGPYGIGHRISITHTRALVSAALDGKLDTVSYYTDRIFGLSVPQSCPNVPSEIFDPRSSWRDPSVYDWQAERLKAMFEENNLKFE